MQNSIEERVEHYADLPYLTVIEKWDDGDGPYYVARVPELPGCLIHGDTPEEALHDIEGAKRDWFKTSLELGHHIPPPLKSRNLSGKFQIRISPSLHESLALQAEMENVSLNNYINNALSYVVGIKDARQTKTAKSRALKD